MSAYASLSDAVIKSISTDPRIPDPGTIAVSATGGIVTLRGTVESFAQRAAALDDAATVEGVDEVDDRLKVDLVGDARHEDHEIRGAALRALISDADVPSDSVDVKVHNGWVTLRGDVDHQYQSDAAFDDVVSLDGVVDVTNVIRVNAR